LLYLWFFTSASCFFCIFNTGLFHASKNVTMERFLILLFLILETTVSSQNLNYIHYNTNNSRLPHDIVYRLYQDKAGFLWIATDDGLVRFDGTEMENIDKGFNTKYIIGISEENGKKWVCTWKGGIHLIEKDSAVLVRAIHDKEFCYSTNNILVSKDLVIVHSFDAYMVLRYDSLRKLLSPFSLKQKPDTQYQVSPADKEYYRFAKTGRSRLYAYNSKGIFEVRDKKLKKLNAQPGPDYIWESPSGQLYYMKNMAIYSTNEEFSVSRLLYSIPIQKFGNKTPVSFRVLPSGNICVGFKSPELHNGNPLYYLINTGTGDIVDFSKDVVGEVLSADIIVDREGGIWLSTDGRGVFHIFDYKYKQIGGDKVFENSTISDLHRIGRDSLFIGTKEGLYLYYGDTMVFLKDPGYSNKVSIKKFFTTVTGHLGIISSQVQPISRTVINGKFYTLPYFETWRFEKYLCTLYSDGKVIVTDWVGEKKRYSEIRLHNILFVEEAEDGLLFVTRDGFWHFHSEMGLHRYSAQLLNNVQINCARFMEGKGLWLGTNKGLYLISHTGPIQHWGVNEGLTNLNIRCLFIESFHSLWIGTQNGLFNMRNARFTIYKRRDGLIADDVSCMAYLNGRGLAVGSSKGLTLFLLKPPADEAMPAMDIERLVINGQETDWRRPIEVPYDNSITLNYRAITFIYPELMSFSYRLHENEAWISTPNKSLVFTDLKPGDYRLELKVKKYNTGFSAPLIINFRILLPWWRSPWFYVSLFISCLGLIYLLLKQQLSKQKQKALITLELAELKMKALQAQLNPHFISNALNTIQYFILKQDEIAANNYLGQFTDLTRLFLEVSRNRYVSLETELELLKNYLSLEKLRFENKFDYSIDLDPSIDIHSTFIPGLLVQPFVENSINHGIVYLPKKRMGLVTIRVRKSKDLISITINDNGIGREKAKELKKRLAKSYRSHSSQILDELRQAYNQIPGCFVHIETFDKENDENGSMGTCVYIKVKISHSLN
jgi:ligand-binding sensor domain-containing protein